MLLESTVTAAATFAENATDVCKARAREAALGASQLLLQRFYSV